VPFSVFQKDRRFAKVLDYHSYAREVRTIYADCATLPDEINNYFRSIAVDFADTIDYQQARSCCMGGNVHFGYHDQGSLAFLVETGTAFQPPREAMEEEVRALSLLSALLMLLLIRFINFSRSLLASSPAPSSSLISQFLSPAGF